MEVYNRSNCEGRYMEIHEDIEELEGFKRFGRSGRLQVGDSTATYE